MLEWLGAEGDELRIAFTKVFGSKYEPFGSPSLVIGGLSDGKKGVQWHGGYDPRDKVRFAGVNLEGMEYRDWPIARLIERELKAPIFLRVVAEKSEIAGVLVEWRRDYWQKQARPKIKERYIAPTPIKLGELTLEGWRQALRGASECLDGRRKRRGRATQSVTLLTGEVVNGDVSPHLTFRVTGDPEVTWEDFLRDVKTRMQPIHAWATKQSDEPLSF